MTGPVSHSLLEPFSHFVAERMGLNFPPERWSDLARGIDSAAGEFGFSDAEACIRWLLSSPPSNSRIEILASHLTVGETYFLRDKAVFGFFAGQILPELISLRRQAERRLRVWSAGCATGEEPYSIAILIRQAIPDVASWNVTILATDINPGSLAKASRGIYSHWSFRELPAEFRTQYFRMAAGGLSEILPEFRRMVTFSVLNLAEDTYPSLWSNTNAMDIIFCRNVLMYFTPARARKAVENLRRCLVDGGWLIVSASEASQTLFTGFRTIHLPGATVYRKDGRALTHPESSVAWTRDPAAFEPALGTEPGFAAEELTAGTREWRSGAFDGVALADATAMASEPTAANQEPPGLELTPAQEFPVEPSGANAIALLARAKANQGRLAEALVWCEKAVAADRLNAAHHYLRSVILLESGAKAEAVKCLRQTLYLDPRFVLAHMTLGTEARREGNLAESAKHFENALSLLRAYRPEEPVPDADGITAARMEQIIQATLRSEEAR